MGLPTTSSFTSTVQTTSSISSAAPVSTLGISQYVSAYWYIGCYLDNSFSRAPSVLAATDTVGMTLEVCAAFCAACYYFGAESGSQCWCGSSTNGQLSPTQTDCNYLCPGNPNEYCGGAQRLEMYALSAYIGKVTIGAYTFVGCYTDNGVSRTLNESSLSNTDMTLEIHVYPFIGVISCEYEFHQQQQHGYFFYGQLFTKFLSFNVLHARLYSFTFHAKFNSFNIFFAIDDYSYTEQPKLGLHDDFFFSSIYERPEFILSCNLILYSSHVSSTNLTSTESSQNSDSTSSSSSAASTSGQNSSSACNLIVYGFRSLAHKPHEHAKQPKLNLHNEFFFGSIY
ncbi:hypothetical protein G7Y89_g7604 [Cudoniella acicularis]|uniref:WSC domain-containing protein n=1 Tax=Cudoniella acicularis TaxID=354080 RepID=A0A8H4RLQ8_9HELO|nr:hypothetical protein G7Y89_g7604 [Cudoniella acicularis]